MTDKSNEDSWIGDRNLTNVEAIDRVRQVTASQFPKHLFPNLKSVEKLVLYDGPRVLKYVERWNIRSRSTEQFKFSSLVFKTLRKNKSGWVDDTYHSFTLGDEKNPHDATLLLRFLLSADSIDRSGEYLLVDATTLGKVFESVSRSGQQDALLTKLFAWMHDDPDAYGRLAHLASDDLNRSKSLAAAINYGRHRKALTRFEEMVKRNAPELDFQKFLENNLWLFGSEYSELLDSRNMVVGQQLDFPLRRTVDGYLEVIEIKTPLDGKSGFNWNESYKAYFPGSEIHKGRSQVWNYLSTLKADKYRILDHNKIDVTEVRGKLIIGSDGSEKVENARRLLNADSHSIEVMSFDSLIRIGRRVLDIMVNQNPRLREIQSQREAIDEMDVGEIPF